MPLAASPRFARTALAVFVVALAAYAAALVALAISAQRRTEAVRTLKAVSPAGTTLSIALRGEEVSGVRIGRVDVTCDGGWSFRAIPESDALGGLRVSARPGAFDATGTQRAIYPDGETAWRARVSVHGLFGSGGSVSAGVTYAVSLLLDGRVTGRCAARPLRVIAR